MDNLPLCHPNFERLAPIAPPSIAAPDRLPTLSELFRSYPRPRPLRRPQVLRRAKSSHRPVSRGQTAPSRLTPSSPLTYCMDARDIPQPTFQKTLFSWSSTSNNTITMAVSKERSTSDPPRMSERMTTHDSSEPTMLSPPLSPPSPQLLSIATENEIQKLSAGAIEIPSNHPSYLTTSHKTYPDYLQGLTRSELLEPTRLDEAVKEIKYFYGRAISPRELKLEVSQIYRLKLINEWGGDVEAIYGDHTLMGYQKRLMLTDLDNEIRILKVP